MGYLLCLESYDDFCCLEEERWTSMVLVYQATYTSTLISSECLLFLALLLLLQLSAPLTCSSSPCRLLPPDLCTVLFCCSLSMERFVPLLCQLTISSLSSIFSYAVEPFLPFLLGNAIKTTMWSHYGIVKMKTDWKYQGLGRMWKNWNSCILLLENANGTATLENHFGNISYWHIQTPWSSNSILVNSNTHQNIYLLSLKKKWARMFKEALFKINENEKLLL